MTMIDLKYKYSKFVYKLCQTICHYVVRHLRLLHLPLKACGSWASFFLVEVVLNEQGIVWRSWTSEPDIGFQQESTRFGRGHR